LISPDDPFDWGAEGSGHVCGQRKTLMLSLGTEGFNLTFVDLERKSCFQVKGWAGLGWRGKEGSSKKVHTVGTE